MEEHIRVEVEEIRAADAQGRSVIPQLDFAAVVAGSVSAEEVAAIRKRGVVVIRDVFTRDQAAEWDDELGEYLTVNGFGASRDRPDARPVLQHAGVGPAADRRDLLVPPPGAGPAVGEPGRDPRLPERPVDEPPRRRGLLRPGSGVHVRRSHPPPIAGG